MYLYMVITVRCKHFKDIFDFAKYCNCVWMYLQQTIIAMYRHIIRLLQGRNFRCPLLSADAPAADYNSHVQKGCIGLSYRLSTCFLQYFSFNSPQMIKKRYCNSFLFLEINLTFMLHYFVFIFGISIKFCFMVPILTCLKKKAFCCELFYCRSQIIMISLITVCGHNLQKNYYIFRQK